MLSAFKRLMSDENGATAIEYALISGILGAGLLVSIPSIGTAVGDGLTALGSKITNAAPK